MPPEFLHRRKNDRRADEQHRLALLAGQDDLVRRADAVDVGRAVGDDEVAGIHHAQVDVQGGPERLGAARAPGRAVLRVLECPPRAGDRVLLVLAAIALDAADLGLEPRVEHDHAERAKNLADSVPPAELLLGLAVGHEVHRAGEIDPGVLEQVRRFNGGGVTSDLPGTTIRRDGRARRATITGMEFGLDPVGLGRFARGDGREQ